jgi:hypothetical protein
VELARSILIPIADQPGKVWLEGDSDDAHVRSLGGWVSEFCGDSRLATSDCHL